MKRAVAFLLAAVLAAPAFAQWPTGSPVVAFLKAADNGDEPAMLALLDSPSLPGVLKGCYLLRASGTPTADAVPIWMCAEGEKASRTVIGHVRGDGGKVKLSIETEIRNFNTPAPPRIGPAPIFDPPPVSQK